MTGLRHMIPSLLVAFRFILEMLIFMYLVIYCLLMSYLFYRAVKMLLFLAAQPQITNKPKSKQITLYRRDFTNRMFL
jgi:hypothetical protein